MRFCSNPTPSWWLCDVTFPADEIKAWIEVTENLQNTLAEVTSDANIEIETEEAK